MPWGEVIGGVIGAIGSSSAADSASQGSQAAIDEQRREFDIIQGNYGQQHNLGNGAMGLLAQLYGIGGVNTPQPGPASYNPTIPTATGGSQAPPGGTPIGASARPGAFPSGFGNNMMTGYGVYANGSGGYTQSPYGGAPTNPSAPATGGANPIVGAAGGSGKPDYSSFFNSPGYQFTLQQGLNAVNRSAAANGSLYSANTLTGENNYAQGAASTQYNNYVNQLLQMSGLGNSANQSLATAGVATGEGISNSMISQGNANASGVLGSAGSFANAAKSVPWSSMFNNSGGGGYGMEVDNVGDLG